eukprot:CAMPEP_0204908454 /NCGR_PEP_ID=MMETSP1397-20131031/7402_1 /ASSEMBLY_ACC=CAM_ASM_000891 /TAXON_ID=49980 /ORGANISM="Climacostomum Climacostomum virens, Strain Stock W-24" /LENGTH=88 /DNA_ID=CAMNT_0052077981 /DNA_START=180 /DNA_END=443 /DNA_ORIENTATION=-
MSALSPQQLEQLTKLSLDFTLNKNEDAGVEAFELIDLNNDGLVTLDELLSVAAQLRGGSLSELEHASFRSKFASYDANSDGLLELEEF